MVLNDTGYILKNTSYFVLMQFLGHNNCDISEVNISLTESWETIKYETNCQYSIEILAMVLSNRYTRSLPRI